MHFTIPPLKKKKKDILVPVEVVEEPKKNKIDSVIEEKTSIAVDTAIEKAITKVKGAIDNIPKEKIIAAAVIVGVALAALVVRSRRVYKTRRTIVYVYGSNHTINLA